MSIAKKINKPTRKPKVKAAVKTEAVIRAPVIETPVAPKPVKETPTLYRALTDLGVETTDGVFVRLRGETFTANETLVDAIKDWKKLGAIEEAGS